MDNIMNLKNKTIEGLKKLAFTNTENISKGWLTAKEYEELTEDQLYCIQEIQTKTVKKEGRTIEQLIKVKFHDKQKALKTLSRLNEI